MNLLTPKRYFLHKKTTEYEVLFVGTYLWDFLSKYYCVERGSKGCLNLFAGERSVSDGSWLSCNLKDTEPYKNRNLASLIYLLFPVNSDPRKFCEETFPSSRETVLFPVQWRDFLLVLKDTPTLCHRRSHDPVCYGTCKFIFMTSVMAFPFFSRS